MDMLTVLQRRGCTCDDLLGIIYEELNRRTDACKAEILKISDRYPEGKKKLMEDLGPFEAAFNEHRVIDEDELGCKVMVDALNPFVNIFQKLTSKQAEYLGYRQLKLRLLTVKDMKEIPKIIEPREIVGSFFEREVVKNANKNYQKLVNNAINMAVARFKKKQEESEGQER